MIAFPSSQVNYIIHFHLKIFLVSLDVILYLVIWQIDLLFSYHIYLGDDAIKKSLIFPLHQPTIVANCYFAREHLLIANDSKDNSEKER